MPASTLVFTLLRPENFSKMPWANGLGSTEQIDIVPASATLAERNFLWRLSSATLQTSCSFSQFPGFQRWLTVLQGQGLLLNGVPLVPMASWLFDGDLPVEAQLSMEPVLDLGLIFNPKLAVLTAHICAIEVSAPKTVTVFGTDAYLAVLKGKCVVKNDHQSVLMSEREVLKLENLSDSSRSFEIETRHPTTCYLAVLDLGRKKI